MFIYNKYIVVLYTNYYSILLLKYTICVHSSLFNYNVYNDLDPLFLFMNHFFIFIITNHFDINKYINILYNIPCFERLKIKPILFFQTNFFCTQISVNNNYYGGFNFHINNLF